VHRNTRIGRPVLAALGLFALAASSQAAIVIVNPSFETTDIGNGSALANGFYTAGGWAGGTTYLVDNNISQNQWFNEAVPDGQQAASLGGQYFGQQLNDSLTGAVMTGTTAQQFDISFFAGTRKTNSAVGSFTVLLQAYNGTTFVGNLASQTFYAGATDGNASTIDLNLGVGDWTNSAITLSLTAPANLLPDNNIRLIFAQNAPFGTNPLSGEMAIDNVSIVAVPEPGFALLGGLGLLGLLRRRR
jgi:hypothetical protein